MEQSTNVPLTKPKLAYAVAHEGGTVWCMEWCTSGCYDIEGTSSRRMGLLAAGCADGCIRLYSLPFPEDSSDNKEPPVYKMEPVRLLVLSREDFETGGEGWQVTKLSWTKEKGHTTIAAGFSNGYIALWNPTSRSPLLLSTIDSSTILAPFHMFYAHSHVVTMVSLIPYGGCRFLASASRDR